MQAGVGKSTRRTGFEAGLAAGHDALDKLGDHKPNFALAFATTGYDQGALMEGLREALGDLPMAGCSGEGVITGGESIEALHAITVVAISGDSAKWTPFLVCGYDEDSQFAALQVAKKIEQNERGQPSAILILADGLSGNCTDFLSTLDRSLKFPVAVVGGTSADSMTFNKTFQYCNFEVHSGSVVAILLHGDVSVETNVSHGCVPIGLPRTVTRSDGGWIHEIDGQPAWAVFKEYLDGDPEDLNGEGIVHLCIGQPLEDECADGYDPYIVRTPLSLDKESGSLFFPGGGILQDQQIHLTRRDPNDIEASAQRCATALRERRNGHRPSLVLQFDCAGRGQILFGSSVAEHIVHPLQAELGSDVPWLGFHTYGEIAPIGGKSFYHNYTVAICAVYEGHLET